jgi:uncharacterized tellurite resistance protein B-like protein
VSFNPKVPPLLRLRDTLVERGASIPPRSIPMNVTVGPGSLRPAHPESAVVERVAPMCELLYLMMESEGHCGVHERHVLRGVARTLSDGALSGPQIDELISQFAILSIQYGRQERMYDVTDVLRADKVVAEAAFTLAATIMIADDNVNQAELSMLANVAQHLGISKQRAAELAHAPEPT